MPFYHDSTGITGEMGGVRLLPEKTWFTFKIVETEEMKSKTGNDMVKCVCKVIDNLDYEGVKVWHYIVFIKKGMKGDSMNVHFRKSIGQPYGGNDLIDANKWIGAVFKGYVIQDEHAGKRNNKISQVSPIDSPAVKDTIPF